MANESSFDPEELQGAALAAFALSVNTIRFLQKKGLLDQNDVDALVGGVLLTLEQSRSVSEVAVHSARELLSGVASDLGVPLKKPN